MEDEEGDFATDRMTDLSGLQRRSLGRHGDIAQVRRVTWEAQHIGRPRDALETLVEFGDLVVATDPNSNFASDTFLLGCIAQQARQPPHRHRPVESLA